MRAVWVVILTLIFGPGLSPAALWARCAGSGAGSAAACSCDCLSECCRDLGAVCGCCAGDESPGVPDEPAAPAAARRGVDLPAAMPAELFAGVLAEPARIVGPGGGAWPSTARPTALRVHARCCVWRT